MSAPFTPDILRRREVIGEALASVERALAAPAGAPTWRANVRTALAPLSDLLEVQVAAYDLPEGVYDDVVRSAPRLAPAVDRLRIATGQFVPRISKLTAMAGDGSDTSVEEIRADTLALVADVVRARQRVADLVWEACSVDLGGASS